MGIMMVCKPTYNWGGPSCTHVWLYWYLGLAYSTHKFCNARCDGCTKPKRPAVWSACLSCDMHIILSAHYVHFCMHVMCGLTWTWGIRKRFDVSFSSSCSINIATLGCNMGGIPISRNHWEHQSIHPAHSKNSLAAPDTSIMESCNLKH